MDAYQEVQSGQRLTIAAEAWNGAMAAARAVQAKRFTSVGESASGAVDPDVISVRNDSGSDLDQGGVLGLDTVLILPADNTSEFLRCNFFSGVTPVGGTHEGKFCVLMAALPAGEIGPALVSGAAQVKVDVTSGVQGYAEVGNGVTGNLVSSAAGSAQVLWMESSGTLRWAVVRLGRPGLGSGFQYRVARWSVGGNNHLESSGIYDDPSITILGYYDSYKEVAFGTINLSGLVSGNDVNVKQWFISVDNFVSLTITGFVAPLGFLNATSRPLFIYKDGVGTVTLKHNDAGSTSGNQIWTATGTDLVLQSSQSCVLFYSQSCNYWVEACRPGITSISGGTF